MLIEDLRYELRPENLAGTPREFRLGSRDRGRLLVVDRTTGKIGDRDVVGLPDVLNPGDLVVLNNSKRIPGVLRGRTEKDGQVELRFVDIAADDGTGLCRIFPQHDIRAGATIRLDGGGAVIIEELGVTQYGLARVTGVERNVRALLREQGTPILGFFYDDLWSVNELNPYFATEEGSVESPLAGLHFTPALVDALQARGIEVAFVTLHSVGSWLPFLEESAADHLMWAESFAIPPATADAIRRVRAAGGRVIACGSTSLRALESAAGPGRTVVPSSGRTDLYIQPGYDFRVIDGYFTNFHQYQTSLMVLDCAVAGQALARRAYAEAAALGFCFYEFGDAVLYL